MILMRGEKNLPLIETIPQMKSQIIKGKYQINSNIQFLKFQTQMDSTSEVESICHVNLRMESIFLK